MQGLKVTVNLEHDEVVVGESLKVEVRLTNGGTAAVEVPTTDETSQFEYTLRPKHEGDPSYTLSATASMYARYPVDYRPMPFEGKLTLKPGDSQSYVEDLAIYMVEPLKPGQYVLSAAYYTEGGGSESSGITLSLIPPKVRAMATVAGPTEGRLGHVIAHEKADRGVVVLQRESREYVPADGIWYARANVEPSAAVAGVASAMELAPNNGVRWFAWLQAEGMGAGVAGIEMYARVGPEALGVKSPILQTVGWQPSVESGTFVALGVDPQERVALAVATFLATGTASVKTVPLANPKMPLQWAARYRTQNGAVHFDVVTVEDAAAKVRVQRQSVTPDKGKVEPPVVLAERSEPLAALAVYPIAGAAPGVVDALFGPVGEKAQMTFLRIPLDGGAPIAEWSFAVPNDLNKKRPTAWAIASKPLPDPIVLAKVGDRLMVRRAADGSEWSTLGMNALAVEHLQLEVIGDQAVWAIWADPAAGIQYKMIP